MKKILTIVILFIAVLSLVVYAEVKENKGTEVSAEKANYKAKENANENAAFNRNSGADCVPNLIFNWQTCGGESEPLVDQSTCSWPGPICEGPCGDSNSGVVCSQFIDYESCETYTIPGHGSLQACTWVG